MKLPTTLTTLVCASLLWAGCGGGAGAGGGGEQGAGAGAGSAEAGGPMGTAVITGMVNLTGTPPANPSIDMREEAPCLQKYSNGPTDPQIVVASGRLANAFVYVKSGLPAGATYTAPSTPVVIDQDACLYQPRVLGVMVGQTLEIRNSDPVLHNIKAVPSVNRGFNISQPSQGMRTNRTFSSPEIMVPLECNVHGWMRAYVGVMSHPFYAVSGADGSFSIGRLPAGTYELEAWHEKLGTRTATVTVADGETVTVQFTFGTPTT